MKVLRRIIISIALLTILYSCREAYTPPAIQASVSYLVVDGIINPANDTTTTIKLSRTVPINGAMGTKAETGAKVTVESDANASYILKETSTAGTYTSSAPLNLSQTGKYRVRIITSGNKTYLSDFVPVKDAPPIDTVTYTLPASGLQVFVSAHDPTNNTRYYRYEYVETWTFHSAFSSSYIATTTRIVPRTPAQDIFTCWQNANSGDITLASSANLTQDVVNNTFVASVPAASEKLRIRYSILVKQYALTKDAYNFWALVKKDTEQLGTIFDAQPSQIQGNIHNVNDSTEPVLGYISTGRIQQKRIFIDRTDLPAYWGTDDFYKPCYANPNGGPNPHDPVEISKGNYIELYFGTYIPLNVSKISSAGDTTFLGAEKQCTDCTLRGFNKKPYFWY